MLFFLLYLCMPIKSLNYAEAHSLFISSLKKHLAGTTLSEFCTEHNLNYQNVLNVKNNKKIQQPELLKKLLIVLGFKVTVQKEIVYTLNSLVQKQVPKKAASKKKTSSSRNKNEPEIKRRTPKRTRRAV